MTSIYPDEVLKAELGEPEFRQEIDDACDTIRNATKGLGTDEETLITILGSRSPTERYLIARCYKAKYGKELYDLMKSENSGDFGTLTQLLSLPIPEAEAKIIRIATKGFGMNEELLWPVICGRTNEEMELLKKAYFRKYDEDLGCLLSSELSGDLEKLAMACLQGMEEKYDPSYHSADKANEDAKAFYKAGEGKWGTDEKAMFDIICKAPPQYLHMVNDFYIKRTGVDMEKALEKELGGKAKTAALFELGMKLNPYATVAKLIKGTCAGMGTDELGLSCAILRYQHILPQVMIEHSNLYSKTIADRVREETNGNYRDLLIEMIVACPDEP